LLGAIGDPRVPGLEHARPILFGLRFGCDLYANVRPVRALCDRMVPLKDKRAEQVDFVVFHIPSSNTWYIVPIAALRRRTCVTLYGPERRREGVFAEYYEAWHLLKARRACTFCLQASAETDSSNSQDPAQTSDEFPCDSGSVWEGDGLDKRNLLVMEGDDPDGLGIVLQGLTAGG